MEIKPKNGTWDKVKLILFSIVGGIVFWIVVSALVTYDRYILDHVNNLIENFLLYFIPYLILLWFFGKIGRKIQWKPLGKNSDIISRIIMVAVAIILFLTVGTLKVAF